MNRKTSESTKANIKNRLKRKTKKLLFHTGLYKKGHFFNYYRVFDKTLNEPQKHSVHLGILIVATNKYRVYVEPLISSLEEHFCQKNKKTYHIFTDQDIVLPGVHHRIFKIEHHPFPYPTLYRFHFFDRYMDQIEGQQLIYIDADSLISNTIGTEIIDKAVVVQHYWFYSKPGTFDGNNRSTAYVAHATGKNYYGGSFFSFNRNMFVNMTHTCKAMVDQDMANNVMPLWHDESVLNRYMLDHPPSRVLSPSYHFPQSQIKEAGSTPFHSKILVIEKDSEAMRS